jgi:hypothetical protein
MDPAGMALYVVAIPAVVAAVALFLARRLRRGDATPLWPGVAAGFAAGYLGVGGLPRGMPVEAWHWLLPIAVLGAVAGANYAWETIPARLRVAPWIVVVGFTVWTSLVKRPPEAVVGYSAAAFFLGWTLDGAARRTGAATFLAVVLVVAVATAVSLVVSGTMLIGQLAGALAAATGACLVLASRLRAAPRSAVPLVAALLVALWMNGILFADLPIASAALLATAPLACWSADVVLAKRLAPLPMTIARLAVAVLFAGAGVAVAVQAAPPLDY